MHLRKTSSAIAFAMAYFFSLNVSALDNGKTTWLWDTSKLISTSKNISTADKTQINNLIAFCKNKRVTEIYLQINRDIKVEKYQYLVASLGATQVTVDNHSYPIQVHALDGADSWITSDGDNNKKAFFDWVFAYQTKANMIQRFAGIHLDVEPYTSALWRSEEHHVKAIAAYQRFINDAIKRTEDAKSGIGVPAPLPGDLPLSFAIPFWFDGETYIDKAILPYAYNPSLPLPNNLAEWLYANTKIAALAVMTYRDSLEGQGGGMWGAASKDLILGARYSKKTIVSADVSPVKGTDPTYVTFYEEGEAAMLNVLNNLRTKIDNTNATKMAQYTFAIHDYTNWIKIKP